MFLGLTRPFSQSLQLLGRVDFTQNMLRHNALPLQAYSALLNAAVKCGEVELAVDVYNQMGSEGMNRERPIFQNMVAVFVKLGRHSEALGVLEDMKKAGQPAEVQLYNLIVLSCTKLNNPRAALDVYQRSGLVLQPISLYSFSKVF